MIARDKDTPFKHCHIVAAYVKMDHLQEFDLHVQESVYVIHEFLAVTKRNYCFRAHGRTDREQEYLAADVGR